MNQSFDREFHVCQSEDVLGVEMFILCEHEFDSLHAKHITSFFNHS